MTLLAPGLRCSFPEIPIIAKRTSLPARPYLAASLIAGASPATALTVRARARAAEVAAPSIGRFVEVDGVRLHYVERGRGEPLVLLHGNGMMIQDFLSSGFLALAAKHYRVIMFDRPGYGYSDRPRTTIWTPVAQADLLRAALARIGVTATSRSATPGERRWRLRSA